MSNGKCLLKRLSISQKKFKVQVFSERFAMSPEVLRWSYNVALKNVKLSSFLSENTMSGSGAN